MMMGVEFGTPTVLYKLDDLVRPYMHKILVVLEPLLIDGDYYAQVKGHKLNHLQRQPIEGCRCSYDFHYDVTGHRSSSWFPTVTWPTLRLRLDMWQGITRTASMLILSSSFVFESKNASQILDENHWGTNYCRNQWESQKCLVKVSRTTDYIIYSTPRH